MLRFMEAAWRVDRTLMCSSSSHCVWSLLEVPGCYCWLFNEDKNGFQTSVTHAILASIYQTMMHGIKWLPKGLGVKFLGGMKGKNTYGIWRGKKSCKTQTLTGRIKWKAVSTLYTPKMGNGVKIEWLVFSRDRPSPRGQFFTLFWAFCLVPAACQGPVIIILLWFCFIFFHFPAESENAGCVLLHTSRKVSRMLCDQIIFFF